MKLQRLFSNRSPQETDLVLAEGHHRIKNDLQLLASWAAQAARGTADPRDALESIAGKIALIGRLHQSAELGHGDIAINVELLALAHDLGAIAGTETGMIKVTARADLDSIGASEGHTVLLITHEHAVNAIKHGFGPAGGELYFQYSRLLGARRLVVSNEAHGALTTAADTRGGTEGQGLDIINRLAKQIGATVRRHRTTCGYRVEVVWLDRPPRSETQSQDVGPSGHIVDLHFEPHLAA